MKTLAALLALMSGPSPHAVAVEAGPAFTPAGDQMAEAEMAASTAGGYWLLTAEQIATWDLLADCESSGRWDLNVGSFDGGLQWVPSTWLAWKAPDDPRLAYEATREQQIAAADRLRVYEVEQGRGGYGPWPGCAKRLSLAR